MSESEYSAESMSYVDEMDQIDEYGEVGMALNEEQMSGQKRSRGEGSSSADPIIPESADSGAGFLTELDVTKIDWTAEAHNQVELLMAFTSKDKLKVEQANNNLFALVSVLAYNGVLSQEKVNKFDLGLLIDIEFRGVIDNLKTKKSGEWDTRLFKYFPKHEWPRHFLDFVEKKQSAKPSKRFLEKFEKSKVIGST